jgi:hypothetical protein
MPATPHEMPVPRDIGPVFEIVFKTECADCMLTLWPGQPARYVDGDICCIGCVNDTATIARPARTCPTCFQTYSTTGVCGCDPS